MSVAEFQKMHDEFGELRKAGKVEESLKHCTSDCYFMTPFRAPYSVKEAPDVMKNPKLESYVKSELTITVDNVTVIGNVAIDRGHFLLKHEGGKKGSYLVVWKKEGSEWKSTAVCFNFQME